MGDREATDRPERDVRAELSERVGLCSLESN